MALGTERSSRPDPCYSARSTLTNVKNCLNLTTPRAPDNSCPSEYHRRATRFPRPRSSSPYKPGTWLKEVGAGARCAVTREYRRPVSQPFNSLRGASRIFFGSYYRWAWRYAITRLAKPEIRLLRFCVLGGKLLTYRIYTNLRNITAVSYAEEGPHANAAAPGGASKAPP